MMNEFHIEKGIPVPKQVGAGRKNKYPFDAMEVGDSFFIKDGKVKTLSRSCGTYGKRLERKFTSRTVEGGARVWRTE
jgi:hypothetical protein